MVTHYLAQGDSGKGELAHVIMRNSNSISIKASLPVNCNTDNGSNGHVSCALRYQDLGEIALLEHLKSDSGLVGFHLNKQDAENL